MGVDRLKRNDWVVATDGGRALILRNDGTVQEPRLTLLRKHDQDVPPTRELGTDKPGRAYAPDGLSGSAMEETNWQDQAEADFLKEVAVKLDELVHEKEASRIVLVAPPRALGTLRPNLSADAQAAISAEVAKDYTNLPVDQIERHLAA